MCLIEWTINRRNKVRFTMFIVLIRACAMAWLPKRIVEGHLECLSAVAAGIEANTHSRGTPNSTWHPSRTKHQNLLVSSQFLFKVTKFAKHVGTYLILKDLAMRVCYPKKLKDLEQVGRYFLSCRLLVFLLKYLFA